jgi:hypothetical protein
MISRRGSIRLNQFTLRSANRSSVECIFLHSVANTSKHEKCLARHSISNVIRQNVFCLIVVYPRTGKRKPFTRKSDDGRSGPAAGVVQGLRHAYEAAAAIGHLRSPRPALPALAPL